MADRCDQPYTFLMGIYHRLMMAAGVVAAVCGLALAARGENTARAEPSPIPAWEAAKLLARFGESERALPYARAGDAPTPLDGARLNARLLAERGRYSMADSVLSQCAPLVDPRESALHALQRARLNFLMKRYDQAAELLAGISAEDLGPWGPYLDFLFIDVELARGNEAAALEILDKEIDTNGPPWMRAAFLEQGLVANARAGRSARVAEIARTAERLARTDADRARLLRIEFEAMLVGGDLPGARSRSRKLASRFPLSPETLPVVRELRRVVEVRDFDAAELIVYAAFALVVDDASAAASLISELRKRPVSPSQAEELRLLSAKYSYETGDYSRALQLAKPSFRDGALRRESMLVVARSYRKLDRKDASARLYERFTAANPNDAKAAEALYVAACLYDEAGNKTRARAADETLRRSYPSSYYGDLAVLRSMNDAIDSGAFDRAEGLLSRRLQRTRRTDEAALYYLASVCRTNGDASRADALMRELELLDPYSFYLRPRIPVSYKRPPVTSSGYVLLDGRGGLIEGLSVAVKAATAARERIRVELARGAPDPAAGRYDACLERARWCLDAGFRDWGERELNDARAKCFDSPMALLELGRVYEDYAMPWLSVAAYQRVRDSMHWKTRRVYDEDFRRLLYPTPFPAHILENSVRSMLPPHLVYAMMREESRFNAGAVSRAGAVGLMQLMPSTGREVARELELPEWVETDLLDPAVNIAFGIWYAASLLETGGGEYLWMLAAYNAGPGNARRWFRTAVSEEDVVRNVDRIDYRETRNYVQRIVESADIYHALYFSAEDR